MMWTKAKLQDKMFTLHPFGICTRGRYQALEHGEFLQTGHFWFIRSHGSTQSAWKQWLHSGIHLRTSFGRYSDKHIGQTMSLGPFMRRLSPSSSFVKDWIVFSDRPIVTTAGCRTVCSELFDSLPSLVALFLQHLQHATPIPHTSTGRVIDKLTILAICLPLSPEIKRPTHYGTAGSIRSMRGYRVNSKSVRIYPIW